jgi:uncharacterized membrane protein
MRMSWVRIARGLAIAAGVVAYPVLAHYSTVTSAATTMPSLGVAVSLAPSLAIALWLAWRSPRRPLMLLLGVAVAGLLGLSWDTLQRNFNWVYFLQHAGTNVMLAMVFGTTLLRGRQPLVTRLAGMVHRTRLAPEVLRYTRQVTLAWTLFFLATALVSSLLFCCASMGTWSVFANFLSFPLILLMFALEYAVRLRRLPDVERHSILEGVRAFWNRPATLPDTPSNSR